MILKNNFIKLSLTENGILLIFKTKEKKQILFSDLDQVYITVNKMKTIYIALIFALSIGLAGFSYIYFQIDLILIMAFLLVITIILKMNDYKSYGLKIRLKNGAIFEKRVDIKSKHETIDFVNDIRKEIYDYKIKKSNEALIKVQYESVV
jgi:ABC-type transport system involved in cytochrome bd biosynthesis fused ATPase/permease subunit